MNKGNFFIAFLIFAFYDLTKSTDIECEYSVAQVYYGLGEIQLCKVINNPNIVTQESAWIDSVNGTLASNDDVIGFRAVDKTINYFPKNLPTNFKDIKMFWIQSCQLQEIHQSDLKQFPNLVYIRLFKNVIEIIEEGLFEFNPNLVAVGLHETNIIHIDANVFDHLTKMNNLWLIYVPCIDKDVVNSRENVESLIKNVKDQCINSEFLILDEKMKNLENQSKNLNYGVFDENVKNFENDFKISKFYKFRPLSYRFEKIASCSICRQGAQISGLETKLQNFGDDLKILRVQNFANRINDLEYSQCVMKNFGTNAESTKSNLEEIKRSQKEQEASLSAIRTSIIDHNSIFDKFQSSFDQIKSLQNSSITDLNSSFKFLTSNQETFKSALNTLKSSQDTTQSSINDIEATVSDIKRNQVEFKETLIKIKNSQNDAKIILNDLSLKPDENNDEKFGNLVKEIEEHLINFEVKTAEKMEKELANTRHKFSISLDAKMKEVEKRIMEKIEEVLEKKLVKCLN